MKNTARLRSKLGFWGLAIAMCSLLLLASAEPVFQLVSEIFPGTNNAFHLSAALAEGPDGSLYGTTGTCDNNGGTIFRITRDGILTTIFTFYGTNNTRTNGNNPQGGLTFGSDGSLYGTTAGSFAVPYPNGTVFRLTTNGDFTTLVAFGFTNGAAPFGGLLKGHDGFFYGTTCGRGSWSRGTLFKMDEAGNLTTLHWLNPDEGALVTSGLVQGEDGSLYGTAFWGGAAYQGGTFSDPYRMGNGTIFKLTSNGTFSVLFRFDGPHGSHPSARLCFGPDGHLYGTADSGGAFGEGTIFKITTNGTVTTLFSFDGTNGARPEGPLTLAPDGWFYGTTAFHSRFADQVYGTPSYGTVFRVNTNGQVNLLASMNGTNARNPMGAIVLCRDGNLYGVLSDRMKKITLDGNMGAIFRLVEPPMFSGFLLGWNSSNQAAYQIAHLPGPRDAPWSTIADPILSSDMNTLFLRPRTRGRFPLR